MPPRASGETTARAPADDLVPSAWIVAAERVVPLLTYTSFKSSDAFTGQNPYAFDNSSSSKNQLDFGTNAFFAQRRSSWPRLAFDRVFGGGFTFGGALLFQVLPTESRDITVSPSVTRRIESDGGGVGITPRFGYLVPLTARFAFWPRIGMGWSYYGITTKVTEPGKPDRRSTFGENVFFGTLDAHVLLFPFRRFAFTIGVSSEVLLSSNRADAFDFVTLGLDAGAVLAL